MPQTATGILDGEETARNSPRTVKVSPRDGEDRTRLGVFQQPVKPLSTFACYCQSIAPKERVDMRRRDLFRAAFAAGFVSSPTALWAADQPSQAEAKQVALKAAALVKDKGVDAARTVLDAEGEFKHGEIYVNVISDKGVRLVYPPTPNVINVDVADAQDVDGKYLIKDILEVAKTKGEGWTQYRWTNPATTKIQEKISYVVSVPDRGVVVYVGVYK